jgi:hypothetical protein
MQQTLVNWQARLATHVDHHCSRQVDDADWMIRASHKEMNECGVQR